MWNEINIDILKNFDYNVHVMVNNVICDKFFTGRVVLRTHNFVNENS